MKPPEPETFVFISVSNPLLWNFGPRAGLSSPSSLASFSSSEKTTTAVEIDDNVLIIEPLVLQIMIESRVTAFNRVAIDIRSSPEKMTTQTYDSRAYCRSPSIRTMIAGLSYMAFTAGT